MKEAGIEVVSLRAQGRNLDQNKTSSPLADHELALELGRAALAAAPEAQALLLPGGLWFAIHAMPILEAEFGKPVLLNITSTTRSALAAAAQPLKIRPDAKWGKVMAECQVQSIIAPSPECRDKDIIEAEQRWGEGRINGQTIFRSTGQRREGHETASRP